MPSTPAAVAVQRETRTIPIVFLGVADPVASGIVARLDRPSGNITGFANFEPALGGKWLELLTEIGPGLETAGALDPAGPAMHPAPPFAARRRTRAWLAQCRSVRQDNQRTSGSMAVREQEIAA